MDVSSLLPIQLRLCFFWVEVMVFHRCLVSHGFLGRIRLETKVGQDSGRVFSTFLLASQVSLEHLVLSFSRDTNDVLFFAKKLVVKRN